MLPPSLDRTATILAFSLALMLFPALAQPTDCNSDIGEKDTYYQTGNQLARKSDYQKALVCYDQSIRLDIEFADAYYNRGSVRLIQGNKKGALNDFQKAAELFQAQDNPTFLKRTLDKIKRQGGAALYKVVLEKLKGPAIPSSPKSTTLTTLVNFDRTNGSSPQSELTLGRDGNFYGTTFHGGSATNCPEGCGTVFRMTPSGVLTTLVSFNDTNGRLPSAGLVLGRDGNFYGATTAGGSGTYCSVDFFTTCGTIFRITPEGALTTLVNFDYVNGPPVGLTLGRDGNFYGTTNHGGTSNNGTIFRMTPDGTLNNLVNFDGTNGSAPNELTLGKDGNFYGTTFSGGNSPACEANFLVTCGTVFRVTTAGMLTTLVSFNNTNGRLPAVDLTLSRDGNFYGSTVSGIQMGTLFKMTPSGTLKTMINLDYQTQGTSPSKVVDRDGVLYGTMANGGTAGLGTVFQLTSAGVFTTIINFDGSNGAFPNQLTKGKDNNLYGTTSMGGTSTGCDKNGCGTIFRLELK